MNQTAWARDDNSIGTQTAGVSRWRGDECKKGMTMTMTIEKEAMREMPGDADAVDAEAPEGQCWRM